ncbi:hypothetical protein GUITHDRAFT_138647 [Guillardia theta CCMP2712]|uniref:CAAX prenyl protease 2/Lysostaphin resistance protein A-like domain-containing protein n=1 Tax=Guillardia theta (strain CCMP2712) TaxID=905079 RepID=L1JCG1_GUITC|nr:hypothetical protein GUITHDRAFT_138647 [Guillardia theta CCMP2712]EKX45779.1 hypothetical protein GUITHDRAFT_138647 [Guillardia theta CCMP2712]|eukprot:XP_005832759.1 hypothetical protein GUITHDRAFT_138647 [Guillardia theta CCMP2712]
MLRAEEERGSLALVLLEARNAANEEKITRVIRGGKLGVGLALMDMLSCYCEAMIVIFVFNTVLSDLSKAAMPRKTPCPLHEGIMIALSCSLQRDVLVIASSFAIVAAVTVYLSWRYSSFFGVSFSHVVRCLSKCGSVSISTMVICFLMVLGFVQQLYMQRRMHRQLFGVDNFVEGELAFSLHRLLELILFAPLREEVIFRFFLVLLARNRLSPSTSVLISGAFFGVIHLSNVYHPRYRTSYVIVQIVMSCLIGTFLCT